MCVDSAWGTAAEQETKLGSFHCLGLSEAILHNPFEPLHSVALKLLFFLLWTEDCLHERLASWRWCSEVHALSGAKDDIACLNLKDRSVQLKFLPEFLARSVWEIPLWWLAALVKSLSTMFCNSQGWPWLCDLPGVLFALLFQTLYFIMYLYVIHC